MDEGSEKEDPQHEIAKMRCFVCLRDLIIHAYMTGGLRLHAACNLSVQWRLDASRLSLSLAALLLFASLLQHVTLCAPSPTCDCTSPASRGRRGGASEGTGDPSEGRNMEN